MQKFGAFAQHKFAHTCAFYSDTPRPVVFLVFMVTGDHPLTAKAIAKQVGLLKSDNNIELLEDKTFTGDWNACDGAVIHGSRVEELTDDQWRMILAKPGVCFARTTPAHKLLIVQKCQTLLHAIVAVTGKRITHSLGTGIKLLYRRLTRMLVQVMVSTIPRL
jgi:hypothetical protein